ncbi:MAG: VCBS repeat-containing protein [Bdellovibrionales bacterium]|nr:VCBS repeat-containing protein [Bdellovibrionales bacterium]
MAVTIGNNIGSLGAQRQLSQTNAELSNVFERLSSGQRINRASDDAAGLAIASSLNLSSRVFQQGIRNINDGISLLNIYDGALEQLTTILTRQEELAEQASNGVYSTDQRQALHTEYNELVKEFNRIVESVQFNDQALLGTVGLNMRIQGGFGTDASVLLKLSEELARTVGTGEFTGSSDVITVAGLQYGSADFDGDGFDDLAVTVGTSVNIQLSNGDGTFTSFATVSSGLDSSTVQIVTGDANGDGITDLFTRDGNDLAILLGNGDGTFQTGTTYASGITAIIDLKVGDFDGDGFDDVLATTIPAFKDAIFLGNGSGTFQGKTTILSDVGTYGPTLGDVDGDGDTDILLANGTDFDVYGYDETNGLTVIDTITSSVGGDALLADVNNDGRTDLIAISDGVVGVRFGNGDGTFQTEISAATDTLSSRDNIGIGDFNGDGILDIFLAQNDVPAYGQILLGNGDGTFEGAATFDFVTSATNVVASDVDGDGVTDLISNDGLGGISYMTQYTTETNEIAFESLLTQDSAQAVLSVVSSALDRVTSERGVVGASQSRLSSGLATLTVTNENFSAAESRIRDADIAQESARLVQLSILEQASAAVLAQANLQPQLALRLLSDQ